MSASSGKGVESRRPPASILADVEVPLAYNFLAELEADLNVTGPSYAQASGNDLGRRTVGPHPDLPLSTQIVHGGGERLPHESRHDSRPRRCWSPRLDRQSAYGSYPATHALPTAAATRPNGISKCASHNIWERPDVVGDPADPLHVGLTRREGP